jgi:hypothetical protein
VDILTRTILTAINAELSLVEDGLFKFLELNRSMLATGFGQLFWAIFAVLDNF